MNSITNNQSMTSNFEKITKGKTSHFFISDSLRLLLWFFEYFVGNLHFIMKFVRLPKKFALIQCRCNENKVKQNYYSAKSYAIFFLAKREYSQKELYTKMKQKE